MDSPIYCHLITKVTFAFMSVKDKMESLSYFLRDVFFMVTTTPLQTQITEFETRMRDRYNSTIE